MRRFAPIQMLLSIIAFALTGGVSGAAEAATTELAAGGLSFPPHSMITVESQEVLLTVDRVRVTYVLRNTDRDTSGMLAAFLLPDIDANAVRDGDLKLPATDGKNFNAFAVLVDGQPVVPQVEQRALAVGLDVTAELAATRVGLFPFSEESERMIAALAPAMRADYLERGLLKEDGDRLQPAWVLKTTAYWRQRFGADQAVTIELSYRPMAGSAPYTATGLNSYRTTMCVQPSTEAKIAALPVEGGVGPVMTSVHYAYVPGADALGPAKRFRLIVETSDAAVVASSCADGLKRTAPAQLDWTIADYTPDEDFRILFVR